MSQAPRAAPPPFGVRHRRGEPTGPGAPKRTRTPRRTQLLLRMSYEGSGFHGVTPQPGRPTVLGEVRRRVEAALGRRARALQVAARTDAGVHAIENFATCWVLDAEEEALESVHSPAALDPADPAGDPSLRVEATVTDIHVFARTLGTGKHYRYRIEPEHDPAWIADIRRRDLRRRRAPSEHPPLPPEQGRIWQVAPALDIAAMARAADCLVGTHDFSSFKVGPLGQRSATQTIDRIDLRPATRQGRPQVVIDIHGQGFLRKMIRIIVGTLAEVGAGLRAPEELAAMLAARSRRTTGQAALARGLTLMAVQTDRRWFSTPWGEPPLEDPVETGPRPRPSTR